MTAEGARDGPALLRRMAIYLPASVLPAVVTLATAMIFTRVFDTDQYGVYGLALVVANLVKTVATVWLLQSIGKFLPPELEEQGLDVVKRAIYLSTALILGVEILLGSAMLLVAWLLYGADTANLTASVVMFVIVSSVFDVLIMIFPAEQRAREYTTYQLTSSAAVLAVRLLLVWLAFSLGVTLMFWSVVAVYLVLLPVMWVRAGLLPPRRLLGAVAGPETRRRVRDFFGFGLPMTLWLFATLLLDVGDRFVIEFFDGVGDVGIYDANYRLIVGGVALLVVPVAITLHPYLMRISGYGVPEQIGQVIGIMIDNLIIIGVLACGVVLLFHNELALLLGPEFRVGSIVMPIALGGVFAFNIAGFAQKPFEISGRTKPMVILIYIAAAVNMVCNFVLVPVMGYVGAAIATLVAYLFYTVAIAIRGRRMYPWRISREIYPTLLVILLVTCAAAAIRVTFPASSAVAGLAISVLLVLGLSGWVLLKVKRGVSAVPRYDVIPAGDQ